MYQRIRPKDYVLDFSKMEKRLKLVLNIKIILARILDEIDKIILSQLGKNARITSFQITTRLHDLGYDLTDRAIRHRLRRLENSNVILGYSAILNPDYVSAEGQSNDNNEI